MPTLKKTCCSISWGYGGPNAAKCAIETPLSVYILAFRLLTPRQNRADTAPLAISEQPLGVMRGAREQRGMSNLIGSRSNQLQGSL